MSRLLADHGIDAIMFAASSVVAESVAKPMAYYTNNTVNMRRSAAASGMSYSPPPPPSTAIPGQLVAGDVSPQPMSPYGTSELMMEMMLRGAAAASGLTHVTLRYFNVAGAHPQLRTGQ